MEDAARGKEIERERERDRERERESANEFVSDAKML